MKSPTNKSQKKDCAGMAGLWFWFMLSAGVAVCWGQREDMTFRIYLHNT